MSRSVATAPPPGWAHRFLAWLRVGRAEPARAARSSAARATTGGAPPAPAASGHPLDELIGDLLVPREADATAAGPDDDAAAEAGAVEPLLAAALRVSDSSSSVFKPTVARLAELLELGDLDFNQAVRLVTREPAVVATVLAAANSPLFRRGAAMTDIRAAISALGLVDVRRLAIAVATRALYEPDAAAASHAERVRCQRDLHRTMTTAFATAERCLRRGLPHQDEAYVAAMFLDVGRPLVRGVIGQLERSGRCAMLSPAAVERLCDRHHAEVGARMLVAWGLPARVSALCQHHHAPSLPPELDAPELHEARLASGLVHLRIGAPATPALRDAVAALGLGLYELRALAAGLDDLATRASLILGIPGEPAAWPAGPAAGRPAPG